MKRSFLILILFLAAGAAIGQRSNISGIINSYSRVKNIGYCGNRLMVDSPALFTPGMQVLLIQMKGAVIDSSNSAAYGDVLSYGAAGNYELQQVDSVLGDTIKLKYEIEKTYLPAQGVQLLPLPVYQTAIVNAVLGCKPWDGSTGGILLLKADTLVLNDTIDITGTGFRGFYDNDSSQLCFGNLLDYFYTDSMHGAIKGEGLAMAPYIFGRGKNANGGGGGNNQNTGGAGGGNFGSGGAGGSIIYRSIACLGNGPGAGGAALTYSDSLGRLFMGGGGGCGHGNNSEGTPGTNGGGICFIMANVLVGNGQYILANGFDQNNVAGSDGAGGGGAGGTVLLDVGSYAGNVQVQAKGGMGGSLNNDYLTRSCMGPAGGGGGGVLMVNQPAMPAAISFSAPGGANGINLDNVSSFCPYGVSNGALPGDTGGSVTGWLPFISARPYVRLSAQVSDDTALCNDQQLVLHANGISSDSVWYSWSTGQNTASIGFLATQNKVYTVTVSDQNGCTAAQQVKVKVYVVSPLFSHDTSLCSPAPLILSAANPGSTALTYAWNTGASTPSISFMADSTKDYSVLVFSDSLPACRAVDTIHVFVGNIEIAYSRDTFICPGNPVLLSAIPVSGSGLSYRWSTGDTTPQITIYPNVQASYSVTVSAGAACRSTHTFTVSINYIGFGTPLRDTTICTAGTVLMAPVIPGYTGLHYRWSSGDSTAQVRATPSVPTTYYLTVTAPDGCTGEDSEKVLIDLVKVSAADTSICPGGTALLGVTVNGIGPAAAYLWSNGAATAVVLVSPADSQWYHITVSDSLGCQGGDSVLVAVNNSASHLMLQLSALPDSIAKPGDTVQLSVSGAHLMNFVWSPALYLNDSNSASPLAMPLLPTDFCLTATDSSHCQETLCLHVGVAAPPSAIAIPDAFSPNGDGKNELFVVKALAGTIVAEVDIFDRQGRMVYHSSSNEGWDGKYRGEAQETGTYICFVSYYQQLYPEKLYYKTGSLNLFR